MTDQPKSLTILEFRQSLDVSQDEFARMLGLTGKGQISIMERSNSCSLAVALKIEELSDGRVDAGTLNEGVAAARETAARAAGSTQAAA